MKSQFSIGEKAKTQSPWGNGGSMNWFNANRTFQADPWLKDWIQQEWVEANYPHNKWREMISEKQRHQMLRKLVTRHVRFIMFRQFEDWILDAHAISKSLEGNFQSPLFQYGVHLGRELTVFYHIDGEEKFTRRQKVSREQEWGKGNISVKAVIASLREQFGASAQIDAVVDKASLSWTRGLTDMTIEVHVCRKLDKSVK